MKSMPMPPYSGGRWGAQSPSDLTLACTLARSALALARSSSLASPRRPLHSAASLGRISSLTIRAVRMRMSLMWSLSPAIGVTVMGIAFPQGFFVRVGRAYAEPVSASPSTTQRPVRARS